MDWILDIIKYAFFGFFGLIGLAVVWALITGNRIEKKWEFEADFRDEKGREFGEFEIELSRHVKNEPTHTFKAEFFMRHPTLTQHSNLQVFLDEMLVLEGMVPEPGRVRFGNDRLRNEVTNPSAGQVCRVVCAGKELFTAELLPD